VQCVHQLNDLVLSLILKQGIARNLLRGGQTRRSGSSQGVQGQNMERLDNTNGAETKIDLR